VEMLTNLVLLAASGAAYFPNVPLADCSRRAPLTDSSSRHSVPHANGSRRSKTVDRRAALATGVAGASWLGGLLQPMAAFASGGATSGKTTSIPRAKLRYYGRITTVISKFEAMKAPIKSGDLKAGKTTFFTSVYETQDGSMSTAFDELKTAGYLLAVAFKIDSKIPPDKIQQVKDYKLMMKEMEKLQETLGGSKADKAAAAYEKVSATLNVYLDGVELPALGDERYVAV